MHDASCRHQCPIEWNGKDLATMPALSGDVAALKAADTANVKWQGDATQKLDEINMNLLNFQFCLTLRH
jgi:hypothetical protein